MLKLDLQRGSSGVHKECRACVISISSLLHQYLHVPQNLMVFA